MKMPAIFVGHGSPMNAIESNGYTKLWAKIGTMYQPKAILMISAHWYKPATLVQDAPVPEQIYDMYGFPEALYRLRYPARGDTSLTEMVVEALGQSAVSIDNSWGIDHGAWSVLVHMYPKADIPVVQLSVNHRLNPEQQLELGKKLAHLRDQGYMIIASGNIVHNLGLVDFYARDPFEWAIRFDDHIEKAIRNGDYASCVAYRDFGEAARLAVPTPDHYYPLLVLLGTVGENDQVTVFNKAYEYGSLSMTGYLFDEARPESLGKER